jgi:drug/metabolite transporter (DMT)-like permease
VWPILSLAAAGCLWGTGFLFGKIAFTEMTVSENVGYRFLFGTIFLSPIFLRPSTVVRDRRSWLLLLAASVIGVPVQFLLQFKGLQLTTVSHASLIVGTLPVLLALSSAIFFKDQLSKLEMGLMLMSAAGAVLIALGNKSSSSGPQPTLTGDLLVLLSMFAALVMILITKHLIAEYGSLQITALMIGIGTLILLIWIEATHPIRFNFSRIVWIAVIAQGILATSAAYLCWNWGLSRVPTGRAGVFLNLEPVVGSILGVVILHENLGSLGVLGGAMIVVSAVYFSRRAQ